ncbi:MAG: hypothetical protein JRN16_02340 [Nitrososphaerota archaeon]|nr:hypothetical protein [Nitrososphaerota archaeon]
MKIEALNRVLMGWADYYKAVSAHDQFMTGDFLVWRLFQKWYCRRHQVGIREFLSSVGRNTRAVIRRGGVSTELYRMASNLSARTALNHKLKWKYRSIENPYISRENITSIDSEESPMVGTPAIQPVPSEYDEIYLSNRFQAFERDGERYTRCGSQDNLHAHHIELVPKGAFDPMVIHRVKNLQTLCADCHRRLPRTD